MPRPTFRRAAAALLLLAAACRGERPSTVDYDGPFADLVREAIPKIERVSGLTFKTPPVVEARTTQEVRAFLERQFAEETTTRDLEGQVAAYKVFGLLADTVDARRLLLDLLTEQIIGFYDPDTDVLYVVESAPEQLRQTTIEHELLHALQDQYLSLDSLQQIRGDNDRATAVHAVVEGQATYEQLQANLGLGDIAEQLPGGWDRVRTEIRRGSTNMPRFSAAPFIIQETLLFPYLSGAEFVRRVKRGPDSIPVPLRRFPASTEQVLHPEAYDAPDAPTTVTLPAPAIGTATYDNNLGEFETRLVLFEWAGDLTAAIRGAAGWDGDRYVLFDVGGGRGLAWLTVWDTEIDAIEFFDVADKGLARRHDDLRAESVSDRERRYTGGGRAMRLKAVEVAGRPAVLWVDVPLGNRTDDVVDVTAVRLREAAAAAPSAAPAADGAAR